MDLVEIFPLAYFYGRAEVIVPTRCEIENFRAKPYAGSAAAAGTCNLCTRVPVNTCGTRRYEGQNIHTTSLGKPVWVNPYG